MHCVAGTIRTQNLNILQLQAAASGVPKRKRSRSKLRQNYGVDTDINLIL
jgi:hypothetical protein